MFKQLAEGAVSAAFLVFFLLIQFPGGTILMALSCNHSRLSGWDWVLSVVVPAYGLLKTLFSSSC